jgi:hypothetical protein
MGQTLIAPFGRVRFRDAFFADVLTSLIKPLVDLEYIICLYSTGSWLASPDSATGVSTSLATCSSLAHYITPFVCALPLWLRFQQCMRRYVDTRKRSPHLLNALKVKGVTPASFGCVA